MKNFTYYQPTTVMQALPLLDARWGTTELLAGGTDLLDLQKEYVAQPDKVVSLTGIPELRRIEVARDKVTIGAGVKLSAIAEHADLKRHFPALTDAADQIGGPQIQNMGTIGGNLCQRNRCWYFRDEHVNCLLKGGPRCFALDGENQYHAIFTQGHKCVIVNPSTLAPPLIALGATVEIHGAGGRREVQAAQLFNAPTTPTEREHRVAANEILVSVSIPLRGLKNGSYEVRQKLSSDWPLVQAAVAFNVDGGRAASSRIVLGHVAPTPLLVEAAGRFLDGKEPSDANAAAAGKTATEGARPLTQNGYKVKLVEVAVKRAILAASGARKYWEF